MLILLSPAKKLDYSPQKITSVHTVPDNLDQSEKLINALKRMSVKKIRELMSLSEDLAKLNVDRYSTWDSDFSHGELKQAVLAFKGDVYQGMDADSMTADDLDFAQQHLRLLSGLHGLLRPLDLIKPYRLEMGTSLKVGRKENLYQFWGDTITERVNAQLESIGSDTVLNLASAEYFKAVRPKKLKGRVINVAFQDYRDGKLKSIFLYVKQARGMMAGFALRNRITGVEEMKAFNGGGYRYTEDLSDTTNWVFTR